MKKTIILALISLCATLSFAQNVFKKDKDGTLLLNNESFYINGIYHVSWYSTQAQKVADIKTIGNAGFNCVHASYDNFSSTKAMLDEAQKLGVYLILEGAVYGNPKKLDADKVNDIKNHPALLGWNLGDDVHDNTTTAEMTKFYNELKVLDPNHPSFFTVYNNSKWNPYFGIGDFIMPYSYPIGAGDPLGWVDHQLTAARLQCIATNAAMIAIPQAYSWSAAESGLPSAAQYRNMVYQNLINNVKGVIAYTFTEGGTTDNFLPNWPTFWDEVKSMNKEIDMLKNVFLKDKYVRANTSYKEGSGENVHAAYWVSSNETYVVVVNVNESGSINASVSLPESAGNLTEVFANKPKGMVFNSTTKKLTGAVAGRDVHVYKIGTISNSENMRNETAAFGIYPNPATNQIIIENVELGTSLGLTDMNGKILISEKIVSNSQRVDIATLPSGMYLVKVGEVVRKIVQ